MEVNLLNATENPERLICQAARNDYMEGYVAETPFTEVMADIEGQGLDEKKRHSSTACWHTATSAPSSTHTRHSQSRGSVARAWHS